MIDRENNYYRCRIKFVVHFVKNKSKYPREKITNVKIVSMRLIKYAHKIQAQNKS